MQIEYKVKFENGGVTITQTVEPGGSAIQRGSGGSGAGNNTKQLASTLTETHLAFAAAVAGGTTDPPGGKGGGTTDPPGGKGGGTGDPPGGKGGGTNDPPGGKGGGADDSTGRQRISGSGKVTAVILGPIVITDSASD